MFFTLIEIVSNIDYPIFGELIKVVGTTLPPPITLPVLKGWDRNSECEFFIKI